jgi:glycolate oxidase FAD binding subunit
MYADLPSERILSGAGAGWAVDGMDPAIAIRPESIEEISTALRIASENGLAVIPRGGGGHADLGNPPNRYDVALDLTRLDSIVEYSPEDLVVRAQAGMTLGALNRVLAERGQFLALDTPLAGGATVGGALSANLTGPARLRYGTGRDLVIGMTSVLSSGMRVHSGGRVVKNVAGYDLNKLYIGAIGTLGVIAEVSFKLHPLPQARAAVVGLFADFGAVHAAGLAIVNSSLGATAVEIAGLDAKMQCEGLGTAGEWMLFISMAGLPRAVERQVREIDAMLQTAGAHATQTLDGDQCVSTQASLRDMGRADQPAALLLRCNLLPADIPRALDRLNQKMLISGASVTASPGSGNLRLIWSQLPDTPLAAIEGVRREIHGMGGNTIVERCPSDLKASLDVWDVDGSDVETMRAMKEAYDPTETLSPGRFVSRL